MQGCGRILDVAMLKLSGVETWSLKVSHKAVDTANANVKSWFADGPATTLVEGRTSLKLRLLSSSQGRRQD